MPKQKKTEQSATKNKRREHLLSVILSLILSVILSIILSLILSLILSIILSAAKMAKRLAYAAPGTTTLVQVDASNNMFAVERDDQPVPILDMYTLGTAMLLYFMCIMTQSPVSPELMVCIGTVIVNCRIDGHEAIMELKEFNDVKVLVESDRVITFPCESRVVLF